MSSGRMLAAFIFLILVNLSAIASGQTQVHSCINGGNYTSNNGSYRANLNAVLSSVSTNIDSNGFYNASTGQNPDKANAIVLCRGDLGLDACRECVQNATVDLPNLCPYRKQAIAWNELCMLRYSNETIFGTLATSPKYFYWNVNNATSPNGFKGDLGILLSNLREQAASGGSLRKVAAEQLLGPDFQNIFALVQCTPDLSPDDCSNCLISAAKDVPKFGDGKIGVRVLLPSCNIRFEIYPFFNETRIQDLAPGRVPVALVPRPPPVESPTGSKNGLSNLQIYIIIGVTLGVSIIFLSSLIIFYIKKHYKLHNLRELDGERSQNVNKLLLSNGSLALKRYSYNEIKRITKSFKDKLGQGGYGDVYKGKLSDDQLVAVKVLIETNDNGEEFINEVASISRTSHVNIVKLLGFCYDKKKRALVYEFLPNKSLDKFICKSKSLTDCHLKWEKMYEIVVGVARGLEYLHRGCNTRIVHFDIKPHNILLDEDFCPKISDFGLAKLLKKKQSTISMFETRGTIGYIAPEVFSRYFGVVSHKSDVYSYGMVLLEMVGARKIDEIEAVQSSEDHFPDKIYEHVVLNNNKLGDLMTEENEEIARKMLLTGLWCIQTAPSDRPSMTKVVEMLEGSLESIQIPPKPCLAPPKLSTPQFSSTVSIDVEIGNVIEE